MSRSKLNWASHLIFIKEYCLLNRKFTILTSRQTIKNFVMKLTTRIPQKRVVFRTEDKYGKINDESKLSLATSIFFFLLLKRRIHRNPWLVKGHLSSQSDQTDISKQSLLQSRDNCLLCVGGINNVKTNDLEKKGKCAMSVDNRLTSST